MASQALAAHFLTPAASRCGSSGLNQRSPGQTQRIEVAAVKCARLCQSQEGPISARPSWVVRAIAPPSVPAEKLAESELATWQEACALLGPVGLDASEADAVLSKAFGWRDRTYWRDEIVDRVPDPEQLRAVLEFLKTGCVLEDADVRQLLLEFPHVLACDLEGRLKPNVKKLEKTWRITGPSLREVVLRNPLILGYTVDCGGDCIAECDYCWARF